jgi:hypothetical protein
MSSQASARSSISATSMCSSLDHEGSHHDVDNPHRNCRSHGSPRERRIIERVYEFGPLPRLRRDRATLFRVVTPKNCLQRATTASAATGSRHACARSAIPSTRLIAASGLRSSASKVRSPRRRTSSRGSSTSSRICAALNCTAVKRVTNSAAAANALSLRPPSMTIDAAAVRAAAINRV